MHNFAAVFCIKRTQTPAFPLTKNSSAPFLKIKNARTDVRQAGFFRKDDYQYTISALRM